MLQDQIGTNLDYYSTDRQSAPLTIRAKNIVVGFEAHFRPLTRLDVLVSKVIDVISKLSTVLFFLFQATSLNASNAIL